MYTNNIDILFEHIFKKYVQNLHITNGIFPDCTLWGGPLKSFLPWKRRETFKCVAIH